MLSEAGKLFRQSLYFFSRHSVSRQECEYELVTATQIKGNALLDIRGHCCSTLCPVSECELCHADELLLLSLKPRHLFNLFCRSTTGGAPVV